MKKVFILKPNHHKAGPGLGPTTSVLGLGDAIKRVTTAVGIKPCEGCKKRAEALNRWTLRWRRK